MNLTTIDNKELQVVKPVEVPFNGSYIEAVEHKGSVWVGVKKTCEELGVDFSGQRKKIMDDEFLSSGMEFISTPDKRGRAQEQMFIKLNRYTLWLAGIQEGRLKDYVRPLLKKYKLEAAEVLETHFTKKSTKPTGVVNVPQTSAEFLLMCAQQFVEQEQRMNRIEQRFGQQEDKVEGIVGYLADIPDRATLKRRMTELAKKHFNGDEQKATLEVYQVIKGKYSFDVRKRVKNRRNELQIQRQEQGKKHYSEKTLKVKVNGFDILDEHNMLKDAMEVIIGLISKDELPQV